MAKIWKEVLSTVAPMLAHTLGGPIAGKLAGSVLRKALDLPTETSDSQLQEILANPSPEQYAQIRTAEIDFKARAAEVGLELEQAKHADRADARRYARNPDTKWERRFLIIMVSFGFFGCVAALLVYGDGISQATMNALLVLLGVLGKSFSDLIQFQFGSSSGSKEKTDILGEK